MDGASPPLAQGGHPHGAGFVSHSGHRCCGSGEGPRRSKDPRDKKHQKQLLSEKFRAATRLKFFEVARAVQDPVPQDGAHQRGGKAL